MLSPVVRITVRIFAFIGCSACLIIKVLTDQLARRLTVRNQKYSREWGLLRNVTWTTEGNSFATVVYGGFTLITFLLLLTRCVNSKTKSTFMEKCFLIIGTLFFLTLGSIILASLEYIQRELFESAIILGSLSFLVAVLFLIDLADPCGGDANKYIKAKAGDSMIKYTKETQTDREIDEHFVKTRSSEQLTGTKSSSAFAPKSTKNCPMMLNGSRNAPDSFKTTIVESSVYPVPQEPIFAKILLPEKQRAFKQLRFSKNNRNTEEYLNNERGYRPGFVAGIARMWDNRAKHGDQQLSTIV